MGQRSVKKNKNIYQISREEAGLTRAQASEKMVYVSESRIEKIEAGTAKVHPDDITAMANAYKKPMLCNYYCANECDIGKEAVPEIQVSGLAEISLSLLASLNSLNKQKERLIEIAEDGHIADEEIPDFLQIQDRLDKMSITIEALRLWMKDSVATGKISSSLLKR